MDHLFLTLVLVVLIWSAKVTHGSTVLRLGMASTPRASAPDLEDYINSWSQPRGITVKVDWTNSSNSNTVDEYLGMLNILQAQQSFIWDIIYIDVIWPQLLTNYLLPLENLLQPSTISAFDPGVISTGWVNGSLYALPFDTPSVGIFYRWDLLQKYNFTAPPSTWDEAETMMSVIVPGERATVNAKFYGYAGQFAAYEGLTCNAVEWFASFGAPSLLETRVDPTTGTRSTILASYDPVQRTAMIDAITRVQRWMQKGYIPPEAISFTESSSQTMWKNGDVLFQRNWFAYTDMQDVPSTAVAKGAPLPGVTADLARAATNGASFWGIARTSRNIPAAVQVLEFLGSPQFQIWASRNSIWSPTIDSVMTDPTVCQSLHTCDFINPRIISRPSVLAGSNYPDVSHAIYSGWQAALAVGVPADFAVTLIAEELGKVLGIPAYGPDLTLEASSAAGMVLIALVAASVAVAVFPLAAYVPTHLWKSVRQGLVAATSAMSLKLRRAASRSSGSRTNSTKNGIRKMPLQLALLLTLGGLLTSAWPLQFLGSRTRAQCLAQVALPGLANASVLAVIAVHDLQVYLIVSSPLRRVASDVTKMLNAFLVGAITLEAASLLLWATVSTPSPVSLRGGHDWTYSGCDAGAMPGLLALPVLVVSAGLILNVFLSVHINTGEASWQNGRVPTLRLVYFMCVVFSCCTINLALPQTSVVVRSLGFAVLSLLFTLGLVGLYIHPRLVSTAHAGGSSTWMGVTVQQGVGINSDDGSAAADPQSLAGGGSLIIGGGSGLGIPTFQRRRSISGRLPQRRVLSEQFLVRTGDSARSILLETARPTHVFYYPDLGVMLAREADGNKRSRCVFLLRGLLNLTAPGGASFPMTEVSDEQPQRRASRLSSVSQGRSPIGCGARGLCLFLASGRVLELYALGRDSSKLDHWGTLLKATMVLPDNDQYPEI
ncbi:hypothetical protein BC828DRAFT_383364 [Blastocladiella britannica]|nr:hypothetical protein BC828DRAFT_383364 [Blastocladiella britannica]